MTLQWLSLVGAIWLQSITGTNSNFPAYSSQLKQLLSLSQLQLNNLAFASDAGKLFGLFSGIAALYLPLWLLLIIGSTLGFIGYGIQFLLLTNYISSLPYALVFSLTVLAGNSICWINTVCYIIALRNFPLDRRVAIGLSTSYQGLSAKIYADLVDALMVSTTSSSSLHEVERERAKLYLLLNSTLPLIVCCVSAPLVREGKMGRSRKLSGGFIAIFIITILIGCYSVITSLLKTIVSRLMSPLIILMGMCVFLVAPLVIPLVEGIKKSFEFEVKYCLNMKEERVFSVSSDGEDAGVGKAGYLGEDVINGMEEVVDVKEEIGVMVMLRRLDFWLYFFVYLFGATIGLVYLNNLGQIAESRGFSMTSSLVSLASSFSFFGRLIPSLLDYYTSRTKYKVSRPGTMAAMTAPMTAAFFILLNRNPVSLHISTAIIGICSGAITSISVSTTTELFGTKNFGLNHNILVTNIPMGSFVFGDVAALLYRKQGHISGELDGKCMGIKCYHTTFIIWGSLCFLGTLLSLVLHYRTRKFFSQTPSSILNKDSTSRGNSPHPQGPQP